MGSSALGGAGSIARGAPTGRGAAIDRVCVDDGRAADTGGVLALIAGQQLGGGVEGDVGAVEEGGTCRRDSDDLDASVGAVGNLEGCQNRLADVVEADGAIARLVPDGDERDVEGIDGIPESKVDVGQSVRVRADPEKGSAVSRPLSTIVRAVLLANTGTRVIPLGDARVGSREKERVGTPVWIVEMEVSRHGREEGDQQSFEHFGKSRSSVYLSDC